MNKPSRSRSLLLGGIAGTLAIGSVATPARAAIVAVIPDIVMFLPADVSLNQTESNVDIVGFDERQCFDPVADLTMDNGTIPGQAQVRISSHLLHADPVNGNVVLDGRAFFDGRILGVISDSTLLDDSDPICRNPAVTYPVAGNETLRGLEPGQAQDRYRIIAGGAGIEVQMDVSGASDQIRVITCCPGQQCGDVVIQD